jgi:hypothetical protein
MKVRILPLVCKALSFNELFLLTKKPVVVFLHYDKKQINPILCD